MRINKFISLTGVCSRRETDRLIDAGRITINDRICEHGDTVELTDIVCIDGKQIKIKENEEKTYIVLNKPVGITCTAQPLVEGNIIQFINYPKRIFPVGRLDKASEGLILLTDDGDIVNKMMRSEHNHEKEYIVTVDQPITDEFIEGMSNGVEILGTTTKLCRVSRVNDDTFRIILTQGLNRQIRRMSKVFGYKVTRLQRIRIMNIELGTLKAGEWRELSDSELCGLLESL
ncbi:pseudouridine synthase [Alkalihalobacterium chitinilyticum]|uniref:Pseudouridine synthase n=1 Tax=Alkalihalobacterium chitinilyticum TaxID=2980103 RepID=A0ABT5VHB3_9BACI|nr:pseudouridine synthase [Alkalihalobacterium chitinilyticum]MDE5414836.1 pseudouridine synthase [Alkalihalobacterium chitinilyticum]